LVYSCPHPALPPSPTRRSSDLDPELPHGLVRAARGSPHHPRPQPQRRGLRGRAMTAASVRTDTSTTGAREMGTARFGKVLTAMVDRKSTRLNSSHVKISYAVFC